jgi:hypothetical protein
MVPQTHETRPRRGDSTGQLAKCGCRTSPPVRNIQRACSTDLVRLPTSSLPQRRPTHATQDWSKPLPHPRLHPSAPPERAALRGRDEVLDHMEELPLPPTCRGRPTPGHHRTSIHRIPRIRARSGRLSGLSGRQTDRHRRSHLGVGAATAQGKTAVGSLGITDVLTVEDMVSDLHVWRPPAWQDLIAQRRLWATDLFDYLG